MYNRDLEAAYALLLLDAPTIGPRRCHDLITQRGSAIAAYEYLGASADPGKKLLEFLQSVEVESYSACIHETHRLGGSYVLWNDERYPSNLRQWQGRPPILFYKGDLTHLAARSLALVGRVDPTEEGLAAAERFARKCVENDITVVSGLAKGIDGASHRASLKEPAGYTYAVVGHGLDYQYPRENHDLFASIPNHGAVISQFSTGTGPQRWTFPARNEVMCTLALGTVIIEGREGCGSIIQAEFSFKHGRPVFILGRNLRTAESDWAKALVSRGAHVIERFDQVLDIVTRTMRQWQSASERSVNSPTLFDAALQNGKAATVASISDKSTARADTAALFDLDGVIVDSRSATVAALADIAEEQTGRPVDPFTINPQLAPHKALEVLGVSNAYQIARTKYDEALARHTSLIRVFDDAVAGLHELRAAGVRLAAVTAQPRRRIELILPNHIQSLFEHVLTYNETGGKKDVGIRRLMSQMGLLPQNVVYIGDQSRDLEAARKAGVYGFGVLWGFSTEEELQRWPHDGLLARPSELAAEVRVLLCR